MTMEMTDAELRERASKTRAQRMGGFVERTSLENRMKYGAKSRDEYGSPLQVARDQIRQELADGSHRCCKRGQACECMCHPIVAKK